MASNINDRQATRRNDEIRAFRHCEFFWERVYVGECEWFDEASHASNLTQTSKWSTWWQASDWRPLKTTVTGHENQPTVCRFRGEGLWLGLVLPFWTLRKLVLSVPVPASPFSATKMFGCRNRPSSSFSFCDLFISLCTSLSHIHTKPPQDQR